MGGLNSFFRNRSSSYRQGFSEERRSHDYLMSSLRSAHENGVLTVLSSSNEEPDDQNLKFSPARKLTPEKSKTASRLFDPAVGA